VSFIETGRSRPGRDVIVRLAACMQLPARAANALLAAAGFGASYPERALDHDALRPVRSAIRSVLDGHHPYPGCAIDARGRVQLANPAYLMLLPDALERTAEESIDAFYGHEGRARIENWTEVAWSACDLRSDHANRSGDPELLRLAARARERLRGVPRPAPPAPGEASPVVCARIRVGEETISTFASALRFETAREVTLSELRIELIFPADDRTREFFQALGA
jgi:hypothetical protein